MKERISLGELPELVRALDEGTREEQCHALRLLCPCRNRVYDHEAWQKIFRARERGTPDVRHQADHAIETLRHRALRDSRSWELVVHLKQDVNQPTGDPFPDELSKIEPFWEEGWMTHLLYKVQSGKEATVYCCQAHPSTESELLAIKVYRPRGAWEKKRRRERQAQFTASAEHEFGTLRLLHAAGADVPKPIASSRSAVLMEWVGDNQMPAPLLQSVSLAPEEAQALFDLLMHNVVLWLSCGWIHGDLSEFNMLYWDGSVKVIDFSQAVDPRSNPGTFTLLRRDIGNVCRYFAQYGVQAEPFRLAEQLWERHVKRTVL